MKFILCLMLANGKCKNYIVVLLRLTTINIMDHNAMVEQCARVRWPTLEFDEVSCGACAKTTGSCLTDQSIINDHPPPTGWQISLGQSINAKMNMFLSPNNNNNNYAEQQQQQQHEQKQTTLRTDATLI